MVGGGQRQPFYFVELFVSYKRSFFFGVPAMAASEIRRRLSKARPRAKTWGASRWTAARWERRLLTAAAAARGRDDYYYG
jgi:hypothetical protein